jgi:hypothetical protein
MTRLLTIDAARGPVVAGGIVLLAVATFVTGTRFEGEWSDGPQLLVSGLPALLAIAVAVLAREDPAPPAPWLSAVIVTAFILFVTALSDLAEVLGAENGLSSSGTLTWVGASATALAAYFAVRRNSAVSALLAGVAATNTFLAFVDWVSDLDQPLDTFRWLLLVSAGALAAASVAVGADRDRHGVALVNAAGLAVLGLALTFAAEALVFAIGSAFGGSVGGVTAGWGWELVILAGGLGLVAYAMVRREPGPAYLGAVNLLAFALISPRTDDDPSLLGWPLVLLLAALGLLVAGLRQTPEV